MSTEVFTGDTKSLKVTFTSRVAEGATPGPVTDPDSQTCTVTVYNEDERAVQTGTGVRESEGIYRFDWTVSNKAGIYWVEFKGLFNGKPQLKRQKFSAKFRGNL